MFGALLAALLTVVGAPPGPPPSVPQRIVGYDGGATIPVSVTASINVVLDGGAITVSNFPATQPISAVSLPTHGVTGPMTNAEARTSPLPVGFDGGPVSIIGTVPISAVSLPTHGVTGPMTNAEARTTPLPIGFDGGFVSILGTVATEAHVVLDGGPVSIVGTVPLPTGAATEATLLTRTKPADQQHTIIDSSATIATTSSNLDVALSTRTKPADQQHAIVDSSVLPSGAATESTLGTLLTSGTFTARLGTLGQKAMSGSTPVVIASDQTAIPVSLASAPTTAVTNAGLSNIDVALSTRTKPADQQHTIIDSSSSIAVTGPATNAELRLTPLPVSGTVTASGPMTNSEARTSPLPVGFDGGYVSQVPGSGQGGFVDGGWLYASGADAGALATDDSAQQQIVALSAIRQLLEQILQAEQSSQMLIDNLKSPGR